MWNVPGEKRRDRAREIIDKFQMESFKCTKNDELSIGQRRRVQVAREFMHDMDLLFLDEPTVGLDPAARRLLLDYIKRYVQKGLTVFFTTHIMEEAEYLCDEIAIINNGTIIATDTPTGLKNKYGSIQTAEIKLKDPVIESAKRIIQASVKDSFAIEITTGNTLRVRSAEAQEILVKIIELFSRHAIHIESISITPPTLEEVFLTITDGKKIF
jgi:ABC-2 type transport system ATP-binding protein